MSYKNSFAFCKNKKRQVSTFKDAGINTKQIMYKYQKNNTHWKK